jgi:adhesin/invasin
MQTGTLPRILGALIASLAMACHGSSSKNDLDLAKSELRVTSSDAVVADGVQTVTIELIARDTDGRPLAGVKPTLSVSGSGNVPGYWTSGAGTATQTPADGTLHITLASTKAETKTIGAVLAADGVTGPATRTVQATFVAGPIAGDHSTVTPPSAPTVADGSSSASVTLVVRDAQGNPVPGAVVTAAVTGGATVNGPLTAGADGTVTFLVTSGTPGGYDITFKVGDETVAASHLSFSAGAAASLRFGAVDATVTAGHALSVFDVTVLDASGNVASADGDVSLSLSVNPGSDVLGGTTSEPASAGVAHFTDVALHKAGSGYVLAAGYPGLAAATSTPITVVAAAADPSQTLVQSTGSPVVGSSQSVTVLVRDPYGNPVSGELVTFSASGGATVSSGGVSDADGAVTASVGSTTSGPVTVSAYLGSTAVPQTAAVTFQPGAPAAGGSTAVAGAPAIANGTATTTITVTVKDAYGNPVPSVAVQATAGNGAVIDGPHTSGSSGTATFTLTSTTAGNSTVTFAAGGVTLGTGSVSFVAGPAARLAFTSTPSTSTAGDTLSAVTVRVLDANGNLVSTGSPSITVSTASAPSGETIAGTLVRAASSGSATFSDLVLHKAGSTTLSAQASGLASATSSAITVAHAAPNPVLSTVTASASSIAVGNSPLTFTVRVYDGYGNPVPGQTVTLTASDGSATITQPASTSASDGSASGTISSHTLGTVTVTAYYGVTAILQTVDVTFHPGAPAEGGSTTSAGAAAVANGTSPAHITITVLDEYGNPVPGASVSASADHGGVVDGPIISDPDGKATFSVTSTAAGSSTVTFTSSGVTLASGSVSFVAGAVDPDQSTFSISPSSLVADGASTSTLAVVARDAFGNPVPGKAVVFSATGSNIITQGGPTNASGQAQGSIASGATGTKTLTATVDGVTLATHALITFTAPPAGTPSASRSTVTPSPATIQADGTTRSAIVVTVLDAGGAPLAGVSVTLALTSGTGTLTQPASVTGADGVATGHVSASAAGSGTISASAGGVSLSATATVSYVAPITTTVPPKKVALPVGVNCTTQYSNTGRKITADQANNIYVVMNCGGTAYAAVSTDLGNSYSTAQSLGMTGIAEVSTVGGPAGIAYALGIDNSGGAWFSRTTDAGATWSAPVEIEASASTAYGATIAVDNDWVYVACNTGGTVRVFRNAAQGAGAFDHTDITVSAVFGDVLTDTDGAVWLTTDDPTFHILKSTDHGVTFGPESNPSGSANFSDWSIGNGIMWVTGTQTEATRIPASAPGTSTSVTGLVDVDSRGRAVSADKAGNAYIASGLSGTGVTLQRALAADTAFDTGRLLDANGTWPGVVAGPGNNTAILVYTVGTDVWATVQVY